MFIQLRKIVVMAGNADEVVQKFSKESPVDGMDGLIDRTVMVTKLSREEEEVVVMIRWDSREDWKNWEKSDVHIQGHRDKKGQEPPACVVSTKVSMYEVQHVSQGKAFKG
ncbi:antibiotic biosynthesis monooxygenase [Paenibacillus sp.]|jgi:heme oxygenase (staphylobilin-producing)|uniref:antibiotic biosynthesis monooxygenase n=1 Tax=Paenibacillus sp. TaxID=58172 RepID=UPI002822EC88|nr:antibiotic biosynthesis monooxygenase [Paenibacillus sp.]MDR0271379.1 antibiotic biosynthesis monooxygenase [Paenibacillus sp.]